MGNSYTRWSSLPTVYPAHCLSLTILPLDEVGQLNEQIITETLHFLAGKLCTLVHLLTRRGFVEGPEAAVMHVRGMHVSLVIRKIGFAAN